MTIEIRICDCAKATLAASGPTLVELDGTLLVYPARGDKLRGCVMENKVLRQAPTDRRPVDVAIAKGGFARRQRFAGAGELSWRLTLTSYQPGTWLTAAPRPGLAFLIGEYRPLCQERAPASSQ
jgi:hypothetical protein